MVNYIVLKFGGTSMCKRGYDTILQQVKLNNDYKIIIVVSAIQKTTNKLEQIIYQYNTSIIDDIRSDHIALANSLGVCTDKLNICIDNLRTDVNMLHQDATVNIVEQRIKILSYGEILSSIILHNFLQHMSINNVLLNAKLFIKSEHAHTKIDPYNLTISGEFKCHNNILLQLFNNECNVYVTQGFIASTADCYSCLLSRSGSDTSASLIGASLKADRVEIWTDVNGLYTADPNSLPEALLIKEVNYSIAQEISASGSTVIHPFCSVPCQKDNVPIWIRNTFDPDNSDFTIINNKIDTDPTCIYSISCQKNVTVFKIEALDMWNNFGFVSDIFNIFSTYSVDVNIITTSLISVTTTTEEKSDEKKRLVFKKLKCKYPSVEMIENCNMVSIIGNDIQSNLKLAKINEIIAGLGKNLLYIKHESSNRLNLSLVVDNSITYKLIKELHREFIAKQTRYIDNTRIWWRTNIDQIKTLLTGVNRAAYVYALNDVDVKCKQLTQKLTNIDKLYYACKANNEELILKTIMENNIGIECVSYNEIQYVRSINPHTNILFTPNYISIDEYKSVFKYDNIITVIDNYEILEKNINVFRDRTIGLRLDLDIGDGHDKNVITEGSDVKFGLPISEIQKFIEICDKLNITVKMLHSHKGSGIHDYKSWGNTLDKLLKCVDMFPTVDTLNLGGGLGIFSNGNNLDLDKVNNYIGSIKQNHNIKIVMEPGRYFVAESGIIISKVNQIKHKGDKNYLGINASMNSIIRPMLYGAYHPIYNITKIDEQHNTKYDIVGNICESTDTIGKNILLPSSDIDDIILIENTGAYCSVMEMKYNMRNTLPRIILK